MAKKTNKTTYNPKGEARPGPATPPITETDLVRLSLNTGWKLKK